MMGLNLGSPGFLFTISPLAIVSSGLGELTFSSSLIMSFVGLNVVASYVLERPLGGGSSISWRR